MISENVKIESAFKLKDEGKQFIFHKNYTQAN